MSGRFLSKFLANKIQKIEDSCVGVSQNRNKCPQLSQEDHGFVLGSLFILGLVCAKLKGMKTIVGKVRRSGVYYLMTTVGSANEARNARSDTWGTVAVVVLLMGVVGMVKLFLTA